MRAVANNTQFDKLGDMRVETLPFEINTRGHGEVLNLTNTVSDLVAQSGVTSGMATAFVVGSTAGITTTEFEPGLANHDLHAAFERIAPASGTYQHEATWNDDNGHSHIQASLLGPSLTIPIVNGLLTLGTWQQIVLIDFDTRARRRKVIVQVLGE